MTLPDEDYIPAAPFVAWVKEEIRRLAAAAEPDGPTHAVLAERLAINVRVLYRYQHSLDGENQPTDRYPRDTIEDLLHRAGLLLVEVYPDLTEPEDIGEVRTAYCPACAQSVLTTDELCPWCDAQVADEAPRRRSNGGQKMTDEQLYEAYVLYMEEHRCAAETARVIWRRYGYANAKTCATQLLTHWKRMALPTRPNSEVARAMNTRHGLAADGARKDPKLRAAYNALRRQQAIERFGRCTYRGKHGHCRHHCLAGRDVCGFHTPEMLERKRAQVDQIRPTKEYLMALKQITDRVNLIEEDLDCDMEGSMASKVADLYDEIRALRARLDEWTTDTARLHDQKAA